MIKLDYKNDKPLHEQITQGIKELIMCGVYAKDKQLPSVRDLSVNLTVNPNTVQRAFKNLEAEGFIYSVRGKGNFVAEIQNPNSRTVEALYDRFTEVVTEILYYGEDKSKLNRIIDNIYTEMEEKK